MNSQDFNGALIAIDSVEIQMLDDEFHPKSERQVGDFDKLDIATSFCKKDPHKNWWLIFVFSVLMVLQKKPQKLREFTKI